MLKQTFLLRFWKSAAPHSPVVVGDQFLLRHEADHRPDRSVITAVVRVLPSCSTGRRDAFRTPASNPTTSSWSGGGLGLLPTRSQEPPHIYGSNITTRSLCIPCSSTSHSSLKKENSGTPPVCRQLCAALYKQWIPGCSAVVIITYSAIVSCYFIKKIFNPFLVETGYSLAGF